ncbi:uncharacterized protein LOC108107660 [Drosophila eugracilis]|uniref:uncharacterized protein LOC108107660 n=1 Tax=Drosophila eugracilis TaxID=29029 RepID=UPI0007E6411D|nr:uncharacterized protein LOC108107660 [Drosophila eugracilis]
MFCTESCEHGCNATSSGRLLSSGNENASQPPQFNMCCAPQSSNDVASKCEMEPPRVGMCLVTECPEGLNIDCNVPLPNSFNLDEYRNQMICSSCCQFSGGFVDSYGPPQQGAISTSPNSNQNQNPKPSPNQSPACSFQCQCSNIGGACSGYDSLSASKAPMCPLPTPTMTQRQEAPVMAMAPQTRGPALMPQIFCLSSPISDGGLYQPDHAPIYLCSLIPVSQSWNVLPLLQAQQLPQRQLMTNPAQDSQLPAQQLLRCDMPFTRLLAELRRDRERSGCEFQIPQPLAIQLYAPTVKFVDQAQPSPVKAETRDPLETHCAPPTTPHPSRPRASSSSVGLSRARSDSPKPSRSCIRNKDMWASGGPTTSHTPYPSAAQHGAGNVCMKCGNCWHCPRCNCSNCFWHPGLGRTPPRESR